MLENKLPAETKDLINKFFTEWNFESKYKSENHMLLFHSSRYLYALKFPTIKFKQYGMTAEEVIKQDNTEEQRVAWTKRDRLNILNTCRR